MKYHRWKKAEYGQVFLSKYKKAFVTELKRKIPEGERKWTGEGWWVSDAWVKEAKQIAFMHYGMDD
jgi:hypothetical protein